VTTEARPPGPTEARPPVPTDPPMPTEARPPLMTGARPPEGLYVHFPFCVTHCPYCDFVVVAGAHARGPRNRVEALLSALHRELELRAAALDEEFGSHRPALTSVYLGGGTPSLMGAGQVAALLSAVDTRLGIAGDAEVTLEANPGRDELGDLAGFRAAGVSRLSIGAQSLADAELWRLGRRHRATDVADAVRSARAAGIGSVNLDLLTDIPGQTLGSWRATLKAVLKLAPEHLSVYTLTLDDPDAEGLTGPEGDHLPVPRGARAWRERALAEQSDERAAAMEVLTDELAEPAGLRRYEVANLARPGHESRHNLLYWRRRPYLALGPGAHASDGALRRSWNAARLDRYMGALERGSLPPGGSETVDEATALSELAILGLRLRDGISRELAAAPGLRAGLEWARGRGLVEARAGRTRLTQEGRLLANEVFARLLPEGPADVPQAVGPARRAHPADTGRAEAAGATGDPGKAV
jgi:oxygen-independent coproporphyrinogen-3 oxidase